ncbi:hypothetical protein AAH354_002584 [Citrobacter sedlakii]
MAKGSHIPYEVRDEVEKEIINRYGHEAQIASVSVEFSTVYFPHKGRAFIWFGTNPDPFVCSFEYKYGEMSEKVFSVTRDWRD